MASGHVATYHSLLVPLNGSPEAEAALPHAAAHALTFRASVRLLRVLDAPSVRPTVAIEMISEAAISTPIPLPDPDVSDDDALGARIYLEDVARRLRADGITVDVAVRYGPTAETILDEAGRTNADLILISTPIHTGIARLVLGSVADELMRLAPCPVLHVHQGSLSEEQPARRVRSFTEDAEAAGPVAPMQIGLREVPVDRIVGSVGRAQELGPDFIPLDANRRDDPRFRRVREALERGRALPPLQLYKLGYDYYVLDGHHRVASARALGIKELEAEVTEYLSTSDVEQQRTFNERREFERDTGLTRIGATRPGTYPALRQMIHEFIRAERTSSRPVDRGSDRGSDRGDSAPAPTLTPAPQPAVSAAQTAEAVTRPFKDASRRWYYGFFQPLHRRIRSRKLAASFPSERSADILVRLREFRREEARLGHEASWDTALDQFAAAYGPVQRRASWSFRRMLPLRRW